MLIIFFLIIMHQFIVINILKFCFNKDNLFGIYQFHIIYFVDNLLDNADLSLLSEDGVGIQRILKNVEHAKHDKKIELEVDRVIEKTNSIEPISINSNEVPNSISISLAACAAKRKKARKCVYFERVS